MAAELYGIFAVGPLACNCSLVVDAPAREAAIIDPGDEAEKILAAVSRAGARVKFLLHTHAHFDHIGATSEVSRQTGAAVALHPDDLFLYEKLGEQGKMFGFSFPDPAPVTHPLRDGEVLEIGNSRLRVLHTPGHSPGSVCFLLEGPKPVLFSGDTLFRESIGRTDLWGGSFAQIEQSLHHLYEWPETTRVIPGHGAETTIGYERRLNPFVRG